MAIGMKLDGDPRVVAAGLGIPAAHSVTQVCGSEIGGREERVPERVAQGAFAELVGAFQHVDAIMERATAVGGAAEGMEADGEEFHGLLGGFDDVEGELRVSATKLAGDDRQALYAFALHDERGALLVDGRATEDQVDIDKMIWGYHATTTQDKVITENNQAGIMSSRYRPGRYSDQEGSVLNFQKWYLNQFGLARAE